MTNKYDIWFNSGQASAKHYQPGNKVSLVEITNSNQQYYQSGKVQVYGEKSSQNIGAETKVLIDGVLQFNGYISRVQQSIDKGTRTYTYQLVGKTYDLWRYVTDANAIYSGTTAFIASSLVSTYCPGISGGGVKPAKGVRLVNDIDLTDMQVGDAIVRLTEIDGYSFYVDTDSQLKYYKQSGTYAFSIKESDLVSMNPVEQSDEDLVNDCLVIGGTDYSDLDKVSTTHPNTVTFPDGVLVGQQFTASDTRLHSVKLYLSRSKGDNQPSTLSFEIWRNSQREVFEDNFDNYTYLNTGNSYNMEVTGGYLQLKAVSGVYATSGMIESSEFYGKYGNEDVGYPCKYMKLDLTEMISSNSIHISGTNVSGVKWSGMTSSTWVAFGEERHGVKVRYHMKSDGTFTPKINKATLTIADDSGGFEQEIFDDDFSDETYISSTSLNSIEITGGKMFLEPLTPSKYITNDREWVYPSTATWMSGTKYDGDDWSGSPINMINNTSSDYILYKDDGGSYSTIYQYVKFSCNSSIASGAVDGARFTIKQGCACGSHSYTFKLYLSGQGYGWTHVCDASYTDADDRTQYISKTRDFGGGKYYTRVKKARMTMQLNGGACNCWWVWFRDLRLRYFPLYKKSGSAVSELVSLGNEDFTTLKLETTEDNGAIGSTEYITYSGSLDKGANWKKLTPGSTVLMDVPGNEVLLKYFFTRSGNGWDISGTKTIVKGPMIGGAKLTAYYNQGGGSPRSGSKVEWSDDISWNAGDVIYPPSWSSWQSYTSPKLALTNNEKYWMIFEYPSGSSKYWNYYYDPNSEYAANVAYSWDGGVNWSSNSEAPNKVPAGNMSFKLGWKQGEISYRASNQASIDSFGRHFKKVYDSSYTSLEQARERAEKEVSGMTAIPKKGTITIDGTINIGTNYRFSSNLANFNINELWNVVSYTQKIDQKSGFTTTINYGKQPFDIVRKVSELEHAQETE